MLYGRLPTTRTVRPCAAKVAKSNSNASARWTVNQLAAFVCLLLERCCEPLVELDDVELGCGVEQRERQRTETAADLDEPLAGLRRYRCDDLCDHRGIVQKMLAELLARANRRHSARSCASRSASRYASSRLAALALPVPASSNAVP